MPSSSCCVWLATVWLPYLDSFLDVASQPADPISSFVSAVIVCPHRFPLDFSALGAYVPCLWSTWCASWSRHLLRPCSASIGVVGSCLVACLAYVSCLRRTKDPSPPSVFEKRVHHAVPRQHAVLNMPACCLQPKNRQRVLGY